MEFVTSNDIDRTNINMYINRSYGSIIMYMNCTLSSFKLISIKVMHSNILIQYLIYRIHVYCRQHLCVSNPAQSLKENLKMNIAPNKTQWSMYFVKINTFKIAIGIEYTT